MIIGAHSIIYSTKPDADRSLLRDVFKLPHVDVGEGWLILGLPPAEVAVHPSEKNDVHEFYLMCDDVEAFVTEMRKRGVGCGPVHDEGWGLLTEVRLPGDDRPEGIGVLCAGAHELSFNITTRCGRVARSLSAIR